MLDLFTMLGAAFAFIMLLTLILWIIYYFQENASILDVGWGIGFILVAWSYFYFGIGDNWKMLVISLMVTLWGARLTQHLWQRYMNGSREDPRYGLLRENWNAGDKGVLFLMLFIFQGVLIIFLSLPFLLVALGSHREWSHWEIWGIVAWCIGVAGESLVDKQLVKFHKSPENQNRVCKEGMWNYSRHPNYFFEILVWVGFFLFALPSNWGILALVSPVIVAFLLLKVTGIPLIEAQAVRTKGDEYREYQRTTSVLIPWPLKKE